MSGIAGIVRFDGETVRRRDLERVVNAMRVHGPDRSGVMVAGAVGFAHVLMRMTPEDQFDSQPCRGSTGALITADLRLDNREDLLRDLGVSAGEALAWPDSRVVLSSWEKFGDAIWAKLRGPFAVAIFDPRSSTLVLARDHLGLNTVMWHKSERFFAFATMPKGLFAMADVPREVCLEKLADFIVLNHADHATTVYRNIFRVPPAHVASIGVKGSVSKCCFLDVLAKSIRHWLVSPDFSIAQFAVFVRFACPVVAFDWN